MSSDIMERANSLLIRMQKWDILRRESEFEEVLEELIEYTRDLEPSPENSTGPFK